MPFDGSQTRVWGEHPSWLQNDVIFGALALLGKDGENWTKHAYSNDDGYCVVGALRAAESEFGESGAEAAARVAKEAAAVSIKAFEAAINRAEATGRVVRETAEVSLKDFEKAVGMAEEPGGEAGEVAGVASETGDETALQEATGKTEGTAEKEKKGAGKTRARERVEARLEILARMYETKKNKQDEEESTGKGEQLTEE